MSAYDLSTLNAEQQKLVLLTQGAILVAAGAGSGKTRLLTHRIAYLVNEADVLPYNILAITFTNKAAEEMRNRLSGMIERSNELWVMTFHSLCVRILRRDIERIGYSSNFSIYSDSDSDRVIKRIINADGKKDDNELFKTYKSHISNAKSHNLNPEEYAKEITFVADKKRIIEVYEKYEQELKRCNALDFDDLLIRARQLLISSDEVREYYQNKFRYVLVDEFQDTSAIQYELVRILAGKHKNVFAVGDEDQSIYGWRGASIKNMKLFIEELGASVHKLEQNYRSTKNILNLANKVIANNEDRIVKNLWTQNEQGEPVLCRVSASESDEADFVMGTINSLVRNGGYRYKDFAVLMRLNALSRAFEERMMYYNIPYKVFGGFKFYERKEIKDLMAYLKVLANPWDKESLLRIINYPKRGIGDSAVAQLMAYCSVEGSAIMDVILGIKQNQDLPMALIKKITPFSSLMQQFFEAKQRLSIVELVTYIVDSLNLKEIFEQEGAEGENRAMNVDEFVAGIEEFCKKNEDAVLEDYLQAISLYSDLDEYDQDSDCVNIATIHSAKGLEFKVVFLVGMEEGIFPLQRAIGEDSLNEERRLMYVGATRAKERLFLTRATSRFIYGQRRPCLESRFIREAVGESKPQKVQKISVSQSGYNMKAAAAQYMEKEPAQCGEDLSVGSRVRHKRFGEGTIIKINGSGQLANAEIKFDTVGTLTLALGYAPLEKL